MWTPLPWFKTSIKFKITTKRGEISLAKEKSILLLSVSSFELIILSSYSQQIYEYSFPRVVVIVVIVGVVRDGFHPLSSRGSQMSLSSQSFLLTRVSLPREGHPPNSPIPQKNSLFPDDFWGEVFVGGIYSYLGIEKWLRKIDLTWLDLTWTAFSSFGPNGPHIDTP